MGLRTMASPNGAQAPDFSQAILNQTLDDYQLFAEPGKPVYGVNIGELVNTVQQFQDPTSSSPPSYASFTPPMTTDCNLNGAQKTVHKVTWDITCQEDHGSGKKLSTVGHHVQENLLMHAFALNPVHEGRPQCSLAAEPGIQHQLKLMQHKPDSAKQHQQHNMGFWDPSLQIFGNATMHDGFSESQQAGRAVVPVAMARSNSSDSKMLVDINRNEDIADKSIERRQKRMIKNRESAARSRARKQAYINQLEDKVGKLADMNVRLKRQMEEMLSHSDSIREPKHQLRRTSSAPF